MSNSGVVFFPDPGGIKDW